ANYLFKIAGEGWLASAQYEFARSQESLGEGELLTVSIKGKPITIRSITDLSRAHKKEAFYWMRSAAMQSNVDAILSLGYYYEKGIGTDIELENATRLYKLASELGNYQGSYNYGYMLINGYGVERDYVEAMNQFLLADKNNHISSANQIGLLYENGHGVEKDYGEALTWFTKAANNDYKYAFYNLGRFYEYGLGVKEDKKHALKWYKKAAVKGHIESKEKIKLLDKN
ncbi:MAG: tetratricopeptide repeat protein, partial [Kangiellaceae bacterium]